ncbi:hypothetical protein [Komagataeibacter swingsii]|uniref:Uncharacterized protein n=1 Tax=Komagataeibacter swingsii TaxID=215220 RepID=A0A850P455_9PROT|nr:hypothetical protein [Komagataeibacter swingsii]NVN37863.1 hypothetical protein [Komagataeibacter swingsii]
MKLFAKASKERRLFEKRQHHDPATPMVGSARVFRCLHAVFSAIGNIVRIVAPADPDFPINS